MLNLAVYYNNKPSINDNAQKIIDELKRIGLKVSIEKILPNTELVLALGGDGTFLRTAQVTKNTKLPILAVRLGKLGFMAEIEKTEIIQTLELFKKKKFTLDTRALLEVTVKRKGRVIHSDTVLNEVVLSRDGIARLFDIKIVTADGETNFRADGIIISSPTGSTAYNLSAGGPILNPQEEKYIITPICPHTIHWQSLVIDNSLKTIIIPEAGNHVKLVSTYDGHEMVYLKPEDYLEIKKSNLAVSFLRFKAYNFKKLFQQKFGKQK
jgi:NAD+ kinase